MHFDAVMRGHHLPALAVALVLGRLVAGTAPSPREDCGCAWQQEYKALHAAVRLGRQAQRYTAVSYTDMGETQVRQGACCGCACALVTSSEARAQA